MEPTVRGLSSDRHIWLTLKMQGISFPRYVVEASFKKLDPEGTER